jgi:N-acetylgalactosamine-N,N'-diacetylbacillosaminyl-diphospho-undecaprenol 4-alpha-N-acetylgalactosaminyltransferase
MKKIILIVPSLVRGGVERVVSVLSKEFSKYYQVFVVVYHGPIEYKIYGKLVNLKTPTGSFLRKIKNNFERIIKIKRLIKEISPDYTISFMGNLQPILTSNVEKIVTVSKGIEKKLNNQYNLKKTKTINNPIDLNSISKKLLYPKPFGFDYILAVGRLSREKGFDILINAFAKSNLKSKVKLIILGEGKEKNNLEKLIVKLDLKSQVLLYGKVDNPFIYMKNATFYFLYFLPDLKDLELLL